MAPGNRNRAARIGKVLLLLAGLGGLGLFGLEAWIRMTANTVARTATEQFGGDGVHALMTRVDCEACPLGQRKMAVWALGQLAYSDREATQPALPTLYTHYHGKECRHETELCQYELWKAIKKIEGTWDVRASFLKEGSVGGLER